uniref:Uncharacterized protein n=2 Tax=unclassified Caudoviricetes TaxID=2788787 RepID=A0AB39AC23_9CAUD
MIQFILMSLLIILSLEVNSVMRLVRIENDCLAKNTGEAAKASGAHDIGSW